MVIAICLASCFMLFSCKKNAETDTDTETEAVTPDEPITSVTIFDGSEYTAKVVYSGKASAKANKSIDKLTAVLNERFGSKPEAIKDIYSDADASTVELLVGSTNREESSSCIEAGENDAWYYIGVVGSKLVINGSNDYMLELAIDAFIEKYLTADVTTLEFSVENVEKDLWEDYCTAGWSLYELPYFKGEKPAFSRAVYDSGKLITNVADSSAKSTEMLVVSNTNKTEFDGYIDRLKGYGYELSDTQTIESNVYTTLTKGENVAYIYYTTNKNTINVILDKGSNTPKDVAIETPETAAAVPALYMYGLNQHPGDFVVSGVEGADTDGMLLIARCADNSVIIVDGGSAAQMQQAQRKELNDFLHEITGTVEGGKINIACWFLTHLHDDHFGGFQAFINEYFAQYDLKSICANIPFGFEEAKGININDLSNFINEKYPDCKEVKIHTGQKLEFAGVLMQALYTHEDQVSATTGTSDITKSDLNHTSTVLKMNVGGMSVMVLGDALENAETCLTTAFTSETLKADVVQIANHAYEGVSENLYGIIDADICLVPNSYGRYLLRFDDAAVMATYPNLADIFEASTVYYSGKLEFTVGLAMGEGEITVVYEPAPCPEYVPEMIIEIKKDEETKWNALEVLG